MGNPFSKKKKKDKKAKDTKDEGNKENTKSEEKKIQEIQGKNIVEAPKIEDSKFNISEYINSYSKELTINESYLPKNVEKEYTTIESEIQQLSLAINDEEEETENESLGKFLYKLKGISLNALELANDLKKALFQEFIKNNTQFAKLKMDDSGCIIEFSSWTKNSLKDEKNFFKHFCEENKKEDYKEEDFNLYLKLTTIYFKCLLCSDIIEFKHLKNNDIDFNSNEMYDLAEVRGNKKKVNFEVLPGLFYNGMFFQNGKIHVFCYTPEKTYKHIVK